MPALHQDHHDHRSDTAAGCRAARHGHAGAGHGRPRARLRSARAGLPRRAEGRRENIAAPRSPRFTIVTTAAACNAGLSRRLLLADASGDTEAPGDTRAPGVTG